MQRQFMELLSSIATIFPAFIIVFTFRGFARAAVALWMGDSTAQRDGFLTLNPLAHVNVVGLSLILLAVIVLGGLFGGIMPPLHLVYPSYIYGCSLVVPGSI